MNQETIITDNEAVLIAVICQLQYRVAKLEGHSDDDALLVAKRLSILVTAQMTGAEEVFFSEAAANSGTTQKFLNRLSAGVDKMIKSVSRLYE